jgi:restriction system protein
VPIPDYQDCMLPLLEAVADGTDFHLRAVTQRVADHFSLTDAERVEQLPSGQQTVIANRVAWAKTYLKKAGMLAQPARGVVRITPEGKAVLAQKPPRIDNAFLKRYPSFADFFGRTTPEPEGTEPPADAATPEETL